MSDLNRGEVREQPMLGTVVIRNFVLDNIIWFILLLMIIVATIVEPKFLTLTNLMNLLVHFSVLGLLAIAESMCLITGNFDLSIESTLGFTAVMAGWLMLDQQVASGWMVTPVIAIIIMFVIGAGIGLINGLLIVKIGLNPFIVTLAMLIILRGLSLAITGGMVLYNLPRAFYFLGFENIKGFPISIIVLLLSFIIAHTVMSKWTFGRFRYAIGGNKVAAFSSGIPVDRIIIMTFVWSSLLATLAGWLLAGRLRSVVTNLGQGMVFDAFAASVIGGISLQGGQGNMIGTLGGVLLLGIISNFLTLAHVSPFWVDTSRGLLILAAMLIDAVKIRIRR